MKKADVIDLSDSPVLPVPASWPAAGVIDLSDDGDEPPCSPPLKRPRIADLLSDGADTSGPSGTPSQGQVSTAVAQ